MSYIELPVALVLAAALCSCSADTDPARGDATADDSPVAPAAEQDYHGCRSRPQICYELPYEHPSGHNERLGDYGVIFHNAQVDGCKQQAQEQLAQQLGDDLAHPEASLGSWLAGVNVQMAFVTAMVVDGGGYLTDEIDEMLGEVRSAYQFYHDPSCGAGAGAETSNLCMDDYSQDAVAWAWMAAYYQQSGEDVGALCDQAHSSLDRMLSDDPATGYCVFDTDSFECSGTAADLEPTVRRPRGRLWPGGAEIIAAEQSSSGHHEIVSFNHDQQNPAYGVGLMTSVASAVKGLEIAGCGYSFAGTPGIIARSLFREGQRLASEDGSFFINDHTNPGQACWTGSGGSFSRTADCSDPAYHYTPRMSPVHDFYSSRVWSESQGVSSGYQFDQFDVSEYAPEAGFLNFGRLAIYVDIASQWWAGCAPPLGSHAPELAVGYSSDGHDRRERVVSDDAEEPTAHFAYDVQQGRFEERPGNGCGNAPVNNPGFVTVQVLMHRQELTGCRYRASWDAAGWQECSPEVIAAVGDGAVFVLDTDPFTSDTGAPGCPLTDQVGYPPGSIQHWEVELDTAAGQHLARRVELWHAGAGNSEAPIDDAQQSQ